MITEKKHIFVLLDVAKKFNSLAAINKLWDFYYPAFAIIIVCKCIDEGGERGSLDLEDIIQESYIVFRNTLDSFIKSECSPEKFSSYMLNAMSAEMEDLCKCCRSVVNTRNSQK